MLTARRLYLYVVSGIALALLAVGAAALLRLTLERVMGSQPALAGGSDADQLAVGLALVIVGLPLFAIQWWLVERTVRGDEAAADAERRSVVRAFYFFVVLAVSLGYLASQAVTAIDYAVRQVGGELDVWAPLIEDTLAVGAISLAIWSFHAWTRHGDVIRWPLDGAAAWLSRLYLYGAIVIGALVALGGIGIGLQATGRELLASGSAIAVDPWIVAMAQSIALAVVGGVVWFGHRTYATRLTIAPDFRSPAERASRVRQASLVILFATCTIVVSLAVVASMVEALRLGLGITASASPARLVELIGGSLITALPFTFAGWWTYERSIRREHDLVGPEGALSTRRAELLVVAGVGLMLSFVGIIEVVAMGLETIIGDAPLTVGSGRLDDLAPWIAAVLVGLPMWVLAWAAVQRSRSRDAVLEAASTARRTYLFLTIGASVAIVGVALSYIVYQLIRDLVGVEPARFGGEIATAIGAVIVGGIALAYHFWVLRSDLAVRSAVVVTEAPPAVESAEALPAAAQELLVIGPPDADFEAVDQVIREHLPSGFSLRVMGPGHAI
ncbi:MAG TPA: DUF5671 domain-containing protein [Candidatus Limnocylindrales bacterium]|nr:DUF5671 domain-containing protein [Candidatus Limnocylindrales bacterium]